jgi:hypothetical protein
MILPNRLYKMPSIEGTDSGGAGDAGQMSLDALRRELVKESILQEIILAELAEWRESESEVRREVGLEHAGPLSLGTHPWLQLPTLPHHDPFPVPRVSVKDRIDEWYRPPWNKGFADDDMLIDRVSLFSLNFICLLYTRVQNLAILPCSTWLCVHFLQNCKC